MQRLLQWTLDLFDPPEAGRMPAKEAQPNSAFGPVDTAQAAPENIASPAKPGVPVLPASRPNLLPSLLPLAEFRHPQANREIVLGDAMVAYALQRARRRSIGFVVGPDGLVVRAPTWVALPAVDAALQEKSAWVLRKLSEMRERQRRTEAQRIAWAHGAVLPYLGEPLQVFLDATQRSSGRGGALSMDDGGDASPRTLHIGLPHSATAAQIRDAVQAWLMRDARQHFTVRLNHFAPLLGVRWTALRLSSAQTRWGSAKADGSIRLNWRLLHYRPAIIDYVVAHELAHLREMNHSPRFWDTVGSVMPDYADLRRHLREQPAPQWD